MVQKNGIDCVKVSLFVVRTSPTGLDTPLNMF